MTMLPHGNMPYDLGLIVPFYNEEKRIDAEAFIDFAKSNKTFLIILVNDCSSDKTKEKLEYIHTQHPENIKVLHLKKNLGKGNAIREGLLSIQENAIPFAGYLDSDLSTSFETFHCLYLEAKEKNIDIIFGSRIKKIDTEITRTLFRHISGRFIATLIDTKFKLGCYDTQCGAKLFKNDAIIAVTKNAFVTRWFFDVEILLRLRRSALPYRVAEIPLKKWEHKNGSKISIFSFFTIFRELFVLFSKYD